MALRSVGMCVAWQLPVNAEELMLQRDIDRLGLELPSTSISKKVKQLAQVHIFLHVLLDSAFLSSLHSLSILRLKANSSYLLVTNTPQCESGRCPQR